MGNPFSRYASKLCTSLLDIFETLFSYTSNFDITEPKTPEGSWKCEKCNNINYPFRTKCNRPSCGEEKPLQANSPDDLATDQDNQVCDPLWSLLFSVPFLIENQKLRALNILFNSSFIILPVSVFSCAWLIYRVLNVTVSPRTVMRVKKVQRRRQVSV